MPSTRAPSTSTRRRSKPKRTLRGGVDLGGTKIEALILDPKHAVIGVARHPTPVEGGPEGVAEAMASALEEAAGAAGTRANELLGVGVGSPGAVDSASGTVADARNLPGWDGKFALGPVLSQRLGTRVVVGNDVQVATDAEFELGAGRPYGSLLGVFWGTGVGGGLVLDRKPWHGRGGAGEIGHLVVKDGGRRCGCGNRGCMEAYAGRASMERRARKLASRKRYRHTELFQIMEEKDRDRMTSAVWAGALKRGDDLAIKLIDDAVAALGAGIASAVNLLDVPAVIIGGGLGVRFGEPYVRRIEKAMHPHLFPGHEPPQVHLAALGDQGGGIGAALQVLYAR